MPPMPPYSALADLAEVGVTSTPVEKFFSLNRPEIYHLHHHLKSPEKEVALFFSTRYELEGGRYYFAAKSKLEQFP